MKIKILMIIAMLLMALPLVIATEDDEIEVFDGGLFAEQSIDFDVMHPIGGLNTFILSVHNLQDETSCDIRIHELNDDYYNYETVYKGEEENFIGGFFGDVIVKVEDVEDDECNIRVRVKVNDDVPGSVDVMEDNDRKVHVIIKDFRPVNIQPNSNGFYYVNDGEKVEFEFNIYNPTNKVIEGSGGDPNSDKVGPDYIFYNNGYPNGNGGTIEIAGFDLTLYPGNNNQGFSLPFYYHKDTLYNTGSFTTVLVVKGNGVYSTYSGITIYVKKPNENSFCGDNLCDYPTESEYSCPQDCTPDDCMSKYKACLEVYDDGNLISYDYCKPILEECVIMIPPSEQCNEFEKECGGLSIDECINKHCYNDDPQVTPYCKEKVKQIYTTCYGDKPDFGEKCQNGCRVDGNVNSCMPIGTRVEKSGVALYCDIDGVTKEQKPDGTNANNDYECVSNSARYGECENVAEQQNILMKMFGWLSRWFGGN